MQEYYNNLRAYLSDPCEGNLYRASLFSSSMVENGIGPDEIVELHSRVLKDIINGQSALALMNSTMQSFTFLLEIMITYGLIHKEYLDTRDAQINQLKANIETIEKLNCDLDYRANQAESITAIANILTSENESIPQAIMETSAILNNIFPGCVFYYIENNEGNNLSFVFQNRQEQILPLAILDTAKDLLQSCEQGRIIRENDQHINIYIPIKTKRINVILGLQYSSESTFSDANFYLILRDLFQSFLEKIYLIEELKTHSIQDSMTGLYNHRFFMDFLLRQVKLGKRSGQTFSLILIDVDNFKVINDNFGHLAGDTMLKKIAAVLKECARSTDITCRYGGDEFAVILPDTSEEQTVQLAHRISRAVRTIHSYDKSVTISIGTAEYSGEDNPTDLIRRTDQALYQAKQMGKNRVVNISVG
ncbi:MAG: diguanylate cyclase [Syntrophomonadaceae bacterium]|nr:diguanylate cyclase [Syntrophomonadaceae bacterium]